MKMISKIPRNDCAPDGLMTAVATAQAQFDEAYTKLLQMYENAVPGASALELQMFELRVDALLIRYENLISAQNVALKAGLTARGE